jgi:hypothetical protein
MRIGLVLIASLSFSLQLSAQTTPESLKGADRTAYNEMKALRKPVVVEGDDKATAENRRVLTLQAKYLVGQLMDTKRINADDLARAIEEAIVSELPIYRGNRPKEVSEKYLEFARELGNIMVQELAAAVKSPKLVTRVNAARMLSVVAMMGCPKTAELAIKILQDDQLDDGTKFYALKTLTNIFEFTPDQALPEQSVFQLKDKNNKDERELERAAIKALTDYILKSRDVAGLTPEQIAAIRYLRREAIRALGYVRTPRLRHQGQVLAHPGLVLLKVANKDGIVPEPDLKEQVEAVVGITQLFPVVRSNVDRDIQTDYLANRLAAAILDIATVKINDARNISVPWKVSAARIEAGLKQLQDNTAAMNLTNAAVIKSLYEKAKNDLLDALKSDQAGNIPNAQNFRIWLQGNPAKANSLFQDEAGTTVKPIGA